MEIKVYMKKVCDYLVQAAPDKDKTILYSSVLLSSLVELLHNSLYSDGFSHKDKYNKDGIVHYVFKGVTGRNFQIIM